MTTDVKRDFMVVDESPSALKRDLSVVRKMMETSVNGVGNLVKMLLYTTEEVRNCLQNDCEIILECIECRSLFRSVANFTIHKRCYCKNSVITDQDQNSKDKDGVVIVNEQNVKKNEPKNLESIVNFLKKKKVVDSGSNNAQSNANNLLILEPTNTDKVAMYQTLFENVDLTKKEVTEMCHMLENDVVVLGPDGKIMDEDHFEKKFQNKRHFFCKKCNMKFLTYRTYTMHSRFHHNENRSVYQCPECRQSFPRPFSVYRHLAQVHQKSPSQIHRIRKAVLKSRIQWKNLRTRKRYRKTTLNPSINSNEKAFLFDVEDCRDLNVCNICGKRFERIAAVKSHKQMCQNAAKLSQKQKLKKAASETNLTPSTSASTSVMVPSSSKSDLPALARKDIVTEKESTTANTDKPARKRRNVTKQAQRIPNSAVPLLPQLTKEITDNKSMVVPPTLPVLDKVSIDDDFQPKPVSSEPPILEPMVNNCEGEPHKTEHITCPENPDLVPIPLLNEQPMLTLKPTFVPTVSTVKNSNDAVNSTKKTEPSKTIQIVDKVKRKRTRKLKELPDMKSGSEKSSPESQMPKKSSSEKKLEKKMKEMVFSVIFGEQEVVQRSQKPEPSAAVAEPKRRTVSPIRISKGAVITNSNVALSKKSNELSDPKEPFDMMQFFGDEIDKGDDIDFIHKQLFPPFNNGLEIMEEMKAAEIENSMIQDNDDYDDDSEGHPVNNIKAPESTKMVPTIPQTMKHTMITNYTKPQSLYQPGPGLSKKINNNNNNDVITDKKSLISSRPIRNRTTKFNSDFIYDDEELINFRTSPISSATRAIRQRSKKINNVPLPDNNNQISYHLNHSTNLPMLTTKLIKPSTLYSTNRTSSTTGTSVIDCGIQKSTESKVTKLMMT